MQNYIQNDWQFDIFTPQQMVFKYLDVKGAMQQSEYVIAFTLKYKN